jgi:hypothetical protein
MNDITVRFLDAYHHLLAEGRVSDAKMFASGLEISTSMMTEIIKGRSNIGVRAIQNIVTRFNVSSEWLLTGEGKMIKDDTIETSSPAPIQEPISVDLSLILDRYEKLVRENEQLKTEIDGLKTKSKRPADHNTHIFQQAAFAAEPVEEYEIK